MRKKTGIAAALIAACALAFALVPGLSDKGPFHLPYHHVAVGL